MVDASALYIWFCSQGCDETIVSIKIAVVKVNEVDPIDWVVDWLWLQEDCCGERHGTKASALDSSRHKIGETTEAAELEATKGMYDETCSEPWKQDIPF